MIKFIKNKFIKETFESIKTFAGALILAALFRSLLFDPYHIPSGSMKPLLIEGDYIFVSKFSYGYSRYSFPFGLNIFSGRILDKNKPERGDVVVFKVPYDNKTNYIKRLIAIPGDKIQIKDKIIYINGIKLSRNYIGDYNDKANPESKFNCYIENMSLEVKYKVLDQINKGGIDNFNEITIPENYYFFMGDNRDNSLDSRVTNRVGFVPYENIVGKAQIVLFSSSAKIYEPWKWLFSFKKGRFLLNLSAKKDLHDN